MLTERTDRQTELFGEGVEAEYFSSDEELLEKIKYYLVHVEKRERIARNGYDKCIAGKLSMEDVLLNIINTSLHEYD
jgi:spore maturation protein CgeB